jgi:hypothetical protein
MGEGAYGTLARQSVKLSLSGNYTTSTWALSNDGSGGTVVSDPPAHNSDDYDLLVGPVSGTGELGSPDDLFKTAL